MSGTSGLVLALGAPFLDEWLGVPVTFLVPLGLFFVAYAAVLELLARAGAAPGATKAVIAGNGLWAALSVVAVAADWLTLTTAGTVLALAQAAAVAGVAVLQLVALRRDRQSTSL